MKKIVLICIIVVFSFSTFGYINILNDLDIQMQNEDTQVGPAMSSGLHQEFQWQSYNEWNCFPKTLLSFDCVIYDEDTEVPSIVYATDEMMYIFDLHVEDRKDCKSTLETWKALAPDDSQLCIYAAHMPAVDWAEGEQNNSLWYINQIKGENGYWKLFDDYEAEE